jgi:2-hydroxy-6-oxonona-2,4-dienedioate hydrolase
MSGAEPGNAPMIMSSTSEIPVVAHISGSGDNVILIHGGRGSHTHWIKNIDTLASHYRVIALDLPGFGDAPDVPRSIAPDDYLAMIARSVDDLVGNGPTAIVGFSFGSAVAGDLCRRLGSRCNKLALLGSGGFGEANGPVPDLKSPPTAFETDPRYRTVIRHNLLAMMLHDPASVDETTVDIQIRNIARGRFNSLKVSMRPTLLDDLKATSCPLMMIWGAKDLVAYPSPQDRAESCRAVRPDLELHIVSDAGHWVQYEAADEVNGLLLRFLQNN